MRRGLSIVARSSMSSVCAGWVHHSRRSAWRAQLKQWAVSHWIRQHLSRSLNAWLSKLKCKRISEKYLNLGAAHANTHSSKATLKHWRRFCAAEQERATQWSTRLSIVEAGVLLLTQMLNGSKHWIMLSLLQCWKLRYQKWLLNTHWRTIARPNTEVLGLCANIVLKTTSCTYHKYVAVLQWRIEQLLHSQKCEHRLVLKQLHRAEARLELLESHCAVPGAPEVGDGLTREAGGREFLQDELVKIQVNEIRSDVASPYGSPYNFHRAHMHEPPVMPISSSPTHQMHHVGYN